MEIIFMLKFNIHVNMSRVGYLLGLDSWVDFDPEVPPYCMAAQPVLPISHQPKLNQAAGGTAKFQSTQPSYPSSCTSQYVFHSDAYFP